MCWNFLSEQCCHFSQDDWFEGSHATRFTLKMNVFPSICISVFGIYRNPINVCWNPQNSSSYFSKTMHHIWGVTCPGWNWNLKNVNYVVSWHVVLFLGVRRLIWGVYPKCFGKTEIFLIVSLDNLYMRGIYQWNLFASQYVFDIS